MTNEQELPSDVVRLVIAARLMLEATAFCDAEVMHELDEAVEAFSERVPYENEGE